MPVKLSILFGSALFATAAGTVNGSFPGSDADRSIAVEGLNFELFDFDGNASISRDEFEAVFSAEPGEADAFDFVDLDHDGSITRDEFETMKFEIIYPLTEYPVEQPT